MTRDLRVLWALEELGLPYSVHGLDFPKGDLKAPDFEKISPFAQLPVLDDDGFIVAESGAILLYLAEKAGQVSADDLQWRTEVSRWTFAAINTLEPPLLQIVVLDQKAADPKSAEAVAVFRPELVAEAQRYLGSLDRWLDGRRFLTGDDFTVADIAMATVLRDAMKNELLDRHPRVRAYRTLCESRPAWARALAGYEARLEVPPGAARHLAGIVGPRGGAGEANAAVHSR